MVAEQVNQVIDKIAEKLGCAAEEVQPLFAQVVAEYQASRIVYAVATGVVTIVIAITTWRYARYLLATARRQEDEFLACNKQEQRWLCLHEQSVNHRTGGYFVSGFGVALTVTLLFVTAAILAKACSPTYNCLQNILTAIR